MRTRLTSDDDALGLARKLASRKPMPLGQAASELLRRGAGQPVATFERNGLQVVQLPQGTQRVDSTTIDRLLQRGE
jgi:hypothetical protein